MNITEELLSLVHKTFDEYDQPNPKLSNIIRKAIRIARLRNDYDNLRWLRMEMTDLNDKNAVSLINKEMASHYSKEELKRLIQQHWEIYDEERIFRGVNQNLEIIDKGSRYGGSIPEMERSINSLARQLSNPIPPYIDNDPQLRNTFASSRVEQNVTFNELQAIKDKVSQRVYEFLSITEKQLIQGQLHSDIFERNRQYVDDQLRQIAPKVHEQFKEAYNRLKERNIESRSQALLLCRRILKSLADKVYPPSDKLVTGYNGNKRVLTEDKYIARLWQFVAEKSSGKTAGKVLLAQINAFGTRIDRLYDLACKGVHADVSEFECNQCVIQTYFLIGDILRLYDDTSAITLSLLNNY
jgi:hypothetical protein